MESYNRDPYQSNNAHSCVGHIKRDPNDLIVAREQLSHCSSFRRELRHASFKEIEVIPYPKINLTEHRLSTQCLWNCTPEGSSKRITWDPTPSTMVFPHMEELLNYKSDNGSYNGSHNLSQYMLDAHHRSMRSVDFKVSDKYKRLLGIITDKKADIVYTEYRPERNTKEFMKFFDKMERCVKTYIDHLRHTDEYTYSHGDIIPDQYEHVHMIRKVQKYMELYEKKKNVSQVSYIISCALDLGEMFRVKFTNNYYLFHSALCYLAFPLYSLLKRNRLGPLKFLKPYKIDLRVEVDYMELERGRIKSKLLWMPIEESSIDNTYVINSTCTCHPLYDYISHRKRYSFLTYNDIFANTCFACKFKNNVNFRNKIFKLMDTKKKLDKLILEYRATIETYYLVKIRIPQILRYYYVQPIRNRNKYDIIVY